MADLAEVVRAAMAKIERVCKWRTVFAGWQLGTRRKGDPESDAVRDHRELSIMLRVEVTGLTSLLLKKGIITQAEMMEAFGVEADELNEAYRRKFPGLTAHDYGIEIKLPEAVETMKGWRP